MSKRPSVPEEHYANMGRITAASAMADVQVGQLGRGVATGDWWTEDFSEVAGYPSHPKRWMAKAIAYSGDELADELKEVVDHFEKAQQDRHGYVHGVITIDPTLPSEDQWVVQTARMGDLPVLTGRHGEDLRHNLLSVARDADVPRRRLAVANRARVEDGS